MRITPLEIRQKTFEKKFRGHDPDEVNAFLLTLSQEWERTLDENKEMRIKLESAEREVLKLREVEGSLYKTLKTAEDTGANVIGQARQTADLHIRESQFKAEAMLNEAKTKAKDVTEEADQRAKDILADMEDRLKVLVENYKKFESTRDDLLSEMRRLASDTLERVERAKSNAIVFDADQHLNQVKREAKRAIFPNHEIKSQKPATEDPTADKPVSEKSTSEESSFVEIQSAHENSSQPRKVQKSFFDEIG